LTEYVRAALGRAVTAQYRDQAGELHAVVLSPRLERKLEETLQQVSGMSIISPDPALGAAVLRQLTERMERVAAAGNQPVILCSPRVRAAFRRWLEAAIHNPVVISYAEVTPPTQVRSEGTVDLPEPAQAA
jgi:flagellar biosynthesis protein FlhA